jgi:citrate lyase subunit beta/citryl-CoA lyase
VLRAKLEIAAACHAYAKVPSHCVVTEFKDLDALAHAARRRGPARVRLHPHVEHPPDQIRTIVDAFAPTTAEVDRGHRDPEAPRPLSWAPIRHRHRDTCTTGPATATSGMCWSAPIAPGNRCRPSARRALLGEP